MNMCTSRMYVSLSGVFLVHVVFLDVRRWPIVVLDTLVKQCAVCQDSTHVPAKSYGGTATAPPIIPFGRAQ